MAAGGHLDPELLRYFLHSRLWAEFARRFLDPAPIDEVDVDALEHELDAAMRHSV